MKVGMKPQWENDEKSNFQFKKKILEQAYLERWEEQE